MLYKFCRFVAIEFIHSDKVALRTNPNTCEKTPSKSYPWHFASEKFN